MAFSKYPSEVGEYAECIAQAQRCRQLADTVRSHSIRQMLTEQANKHEAKALMFNGPAATD